MDDINKILEKIKYQNENTREVLFEKNNLYYYKKEISTGECLEQCVIFECAISDYKHKYKPEARIGSVHCTTRVHNRGFDIGGSYIICKKIKQAIT